MKHRFVKEFARYMQAQLIGGFDGLTDAEKNERINKINNSIACFDRGLITPVETVGAILSIGGGEL